MSTGLRIALVGWGRMGRAVREAAAERGHRIVSVIDPVADGADHRRIDGGAVAGADVAIEFTEPTAVVDNIETLLGAGVPALVVGTTGWLDRLPEVAERVRHHGAGLVHAANFSPGVHVFLRMVENAARMVNDLGDYDVHVEERHHAGKKDSPSGTARVLAGALLERLDAKARLVTDRLDRAPAPDELHVVSSRAGREPGTHRVVFDSEGDTIELVHRARGRAGFARGAVRAAEWVRGRTGVFTIRDVLSGAGREETT